MTRPGPLGGAGAPGARIGASGTGARTRGVARPGGPPVELDGGSLSIDQLVAVARAGAEVRLDPAAEARVASAHARLHQAAASGRPIYGLTTGVGALDGDRAAPAPVGERQVALLRSHAAGVGEPMADDQVRAMLVARANTLARGVSGVAPGSLAAWLALLARGVTPVVPAAGSVGASDLAPLAHAALVLVGEGRARVGGAALPAAEALARAGLQPVALVGRDALAFINGLAQSSALGALAVHDAARLLAAAELSAALTLWAGGAPRDFLDPRLAREKGHPGQAESAARTRALLEGGEETACRGRHGGTAAAAEPGRAHPTAPAEPARPRLRAPLSSRYAPQVTGAARTALAVAEAAVETELNAGADNPVILADGTTWSNSATTGGHELATALDALAAALVPVAVAAERRVAALLDGRSTDLPAFLRHPRARAGTDSGFMIAQYSAAAVVAELRARAMPRSVQSVPTCPGEDLVSMSAPAARHAGWVVGEVETTIAIELLCAAQAADLATAAGGPPLPPALAAAHHAVREVVPVQVEDRLLGDDIAQVLALVRSGRLR